MAYHDRLAALAREAEQVGHAAKSRRLQRAAGDLAAKHEEVARRPRAGKREGPGTYPWNECVDDQVRRGYPQERAKQICGRIRADSRERYPAYWEARGSGRPGANPAASNPFPLIPLVALGAHGASELAVQGVAHHIAAAANPEPTEPFCALSLDAGPHWKGGVRDHLVVVDRGGNILEVWENGAPVDMQAFLAAHPDLPIFGPLRVVAPDVRNARRRAAKFIGSKG